MIQYKKMMTQLPEFKSLHFILWYVLIALLIINITLVWIVSFRVPINEPAPIKYILQNEAAIFWTLVVDTILLVLIFIASIFITWQSIELAHPLSFGGIYIYGATILLLSSFFVLSPSPSYDGSRFIDSHPIIFYDAILLLVLGILGAVTNTIKDVYRLKYGTSVNIRPDGPRTIFYR